MQMSDTSSRILAGLLEARTGQQLAMSRRWRIETALASLMRERGIATLDQLVSILVIGPGAGARRRRSSRPCSTTRPISSATGCRSTCCSACASARSREARAEQKRLRIWCAGCSTGQEAYSLAMMFADEAERWQGWTIDILGTDVSRCGDRAGARGTYSQFEVQRGLPVMQMIRWFEEMRRRLADPEPLRDRSASRCTA